MAGNVVLQQSQSIVPPSASATSSVLPDFVHDRTASNGGHGTDDALRITRILEEHGIPCFLVGVSAPIFYGAVTVRHGWEICAPTNSVDEANKLLQSEPHYKNYSLEPWLHRDRSLIYTCSRFKSRGVNHGFGLLTSVSVHFEYGAANIVRKKKGLPYPSLVNFIHSCLDRRSMVDLVEVVDGTDVSEQWREDNPQLHEANDTQWEEDANRRGMEFDGVIFAQWGISFPDMPEGRLSMW